jgi:hypothetical protein
MPIIKYAPLAAARIIRAKDVILKKEERETCLSADSWQKKKLETSLQETLPITEFSFHSVCKSVNIFFFFPSKKKYTLT